MPLDNHIPENAQPGIRVPSEPKELEENEVILKRVPSDGDDVSNKVSMSSTAQGSNIFERTEVLAGKAASVSPVSERRGKADRRAFSLLVYFGAAKGFISLKGWLRIECISKASKE